MKMKNRSVFLSIMLVSLALMMTACNPHAHNFADTLKYEAKEGELYSVKVCPCGEKEYSLVENGLIATPETAQEVLDKASSNEIVYFTDGEYGSLEIRQSKFTTKAYAVNGTEEIAIEDLNDTGNYDYKRTLEDVVFAASDDAIFKGTFSIKAAHMYSYEGHVSYDAVREINCVSTNTSYYSHMYIKNIEFINFHFMNESDQFWIDTGFSLADSYIDGWKFNDCSFTKTQTVDAPTKTSVHFQTDIDSYKNLVFDSCAFENGFQGIFTQNVDNLTVKDCIFNNFIHNSIQVMSATNSQYTGNIIIQNNTIEDDSDRAIKLYKGKDATVTITGNNFKNAKDENAQVIQIADSLVDVKYTVTDNLYEGTPMEEATEGTVAKVFSVPTPTV